MLRHVSKRAFSGFNVLDKFSTIKNILYAPYRHISSALRSDGTYSNVAPNLTYEAFEEQLHEYYAAYSGNPFHLQVYNATENVQTTNFGTVDNPCVVFTADTPFRYVGCTGLQNEDDYEQHELHMFMLREGPLQRCPMCGQVFKLVRLRQELDEEMEFYQDSFHPIDPFELDNENIQMFNLFKMHTHHEPSLFESSHYGLIGAGMDNDIHDRLLTDPAYRMFRFKHAEDKLQVWREALNEAGYNNEHYRNPKYKQPLNKLLYETVIEAEKVMAIYERLQRKVYRFAARELIDPANHERRERRMRQLQKERWENSYAYFFGGLTEEEQQYNDYFKTDQEQDPDDELLEQRLDEQEALRNPIYDPTRFDFQEQYTHNPEEDQTSLLEKKFWRFRYRLATDSTKDFQERQKRMISRQLHRMTKDEEYRRIFNQLKEAQMSGDKTKILIAEREYYKLTAKEGFLLYKDYYEGDATAEIELVEELYKSTPAAFNQIFTNFSTQLFQNDGYVTFPKRPWDESLGLIQNYVLDLRDFQSNIKPKADKLGNQVGLADVLPLDEQTLLKSGLMQAEQEAQKKIEAQRTQSAEAKPAEAKPTEAKPVAAKPAEVKATQAKPAEAPKQAQQPKQEEPKREEPKRDERKKPRKE